MSLEEISTRQMWLIGLIAAPLLAAIWFSIKWICKRCRLNRAVLVTAEAPPAPKIGIAVKAENRSDNVIHLVDFYIEAKGLNDQWRRIKQGFHGSSLTPGSPFNLCWGQQEMVRRIREAKLSLPRKCRAVFTHNNKKTKYGSKWFSLSEAEPTELASTEESTFPEVVDQHDPSAEQEDIEGTGKVDTPRLDVVVKYERGSGKHRTEFGVSVTLTNRGEQSIRVEMVCLRRHNAGEGEPLCPVPNMKFYNGILREFAPRDRDGNFIPRRVLLAAFGLNKSYGGIPEAMKVSLVIADTLDNKYESNPFTIPPEPK